MKRSLLMACVVQLCLGIVQAQDLPVFEAQGDTSYGQVAKYLNPGGTTYLYQSAAEWGKTLDALVPAVRSLVLATAGRHDREEFEVLFHFIEAFVKDSGLKELNGVGASSIPIGDGLYHNRVYFGHGEGGGKGLLWDMTAKENAPLELLKAAPADTVVATRVPLRGALLWKWFRDTMATVDNAEFRQEFQREVIEDLLDEGIDLDKLLASLGDGAGLVVTVTPRPDGAAAPAGGIEAAFMDLASRLSFAVLVEVKDDAIFSTLEATFAKMNAPFARRDMGKIKALVFQRNLPVPNQAFVFARFGKYLAFASNDRIVKALDEGKGGLTETAEFKRLAAKLPREGVGFSFLSAHLGNEISSAMAALEQEAHGAQMATFMALLMQGTALSKNQASYAVTQRTADGLVSMNTATFSLLDGLVGQTLISPVMLLGTRASAVGVERQVAGGRHTTIQAVNNLKRVGLCLLMYANDWEEQFPPDLGEALDRGYLEGNGRVFVVPGSGTVPPTTGAELRGGRCDLLYFASGMRMGQIAKPSETPVACTKPGLLPNGQIAVVYADGHVETHADIPASVKALIAKAAKRGATLTKQDAKYARVRGLKLGAHLAQSRPKARILLLMPPAPKGGPDEALVDGLKAGLGDGATIVETVTMEPPKDAKELQWFTGELVNKRTAAFKGKVDLVVTGLGLPEEGIQSLWFWGAQVPVALAAGDVSSLRRAIEAKLVIAAAASNPDVIPDDWQPPQELDAAFAKRYLLLTPENVLAMAQKYAKLFQ